jgi:hypothetical protein
MQDHRDTFSNGFIAGLAFPIIFYFVFKGIGWLIAYFFMPEWWGFSDKLSFSVGIVANIIPFRVFTRNEFGYAMQGIISATFILIFGAMYYFRNYFFQ